MANDQAQKSPTGPEFAELVKEHKVAASACLAGLPCRYDGCSKPHALITKWHDQGQLLLICPEQLGQLPTPRVPAGLEGGDGHAVWNNQARVVNREQVDVTQAFTSGAQKAWKMLEEAGIELVVLKEHSPSCGVHSTGGADGKRLAGCGVACALFQEHGMLVVSDEELAAGAVKVESCA